MGNGLQAIREGADVVIAVGGDGTLHEVQNFLSYFHLQYIIKYCSEFGRADDKLNCDKQVVNGFFWDGKPVANWNTEAVHSTALGVRISIKLFLFFPSFHFVSIVVSLRLNDSLEFIHTSCSFVFACTLVELFDPDRKSVV